MKCEDVLIALQRTGDVADLAKRAAAEHLARCEECRTAAHALAVLRADRDLPIPLPGDDVFERAVARAAAGAATAPGRFREAHPRRTFWLGAGVGAMAAALAIAAIGLRPDSSLPAARAPQVTLALNQVRDVNVALNSPEPLTNAEISIVLRGDVGLRGFGDQRELHWTADLDRGSNQLTLPLVGLGVGGGQVVVQVEHGDKRRAFVVDVQTAGVPEARSMEPEAGSIVMDTAAVI
jgi:hypothetical protein